MSGVEGEAASGTAMRILDIAELLIQTRGYNAFSYKDISHVLGIRKASIHYHFPTKPELGVAVLDRYSSRLDAALTVIAADPGASAIAMLDRYIEPYLEFAGTPNRVCLSGALAGEMMALPDEMRERVDRFFRSHQAWLAHIVERGAKAGEFKLSAPPEKVARVVFGALQGGLLVKRTTGDIGQFLDIVATLKSQLRGA